MELSVDNIRNHPKMLDEYTPDEKSFIDQNWEQFNNEEQHAFANFHQPGVIAEEAVETPVDTTPVAAETPQTPAAPQVTPTPAETPPVFRTAEEAQTFVQKVIDAREAAKTPVSEQTIDQKKAVKFFEDNYTPETADKFLNDLLENPSFADILADKLTPKIQQKLEAEKAKQTDALQAKYTTWNNQYTELITAGKVPALNTDEGKAINSSIATLANKYKIDNYGDAYDLWSKLPEDQRPGYITPEATKKQQLTTQKKAASMVGKGSGVEKPTPAKGYDYAKDHGKRMDQILEEV